MQSSPVQSSPVQSSPVQSSGLTLNFLKFYVYLKIIKYNGNIIITYEHEFFNKADLIKLYAKCKKDGIRNINFYNSSFDNSPKLSLPINQFPNFVNNFIKEFEKF